VLVSTKDVKFHPITSSIDRKSTDHSSSDSSEKNRYGLVFDLYLTLDLFFLKQFRCLTEILTSTNRLFPRRKQSESPGNVSAASIYFLILFSHLIFYTGSNSGTVIPLSTPVIDASPPHSSEDDGNLLLNTVDSSLNAEHHRECVSVLRQINFPFFDF